MKKYRKTVETSTPYSKKVVPKVKYKVEKNLKNDIDNGLVALIDRVFISKNLYYQTPMLDTRFITSKLTPNEYFHLYEWAKYGLLRYNALDHLYWEGVPLGTYKKCINKFKKTGAIRPFRGLYYLNPVIMSYMGKLSYDIVKLFEDINSENGVRI